MVSKIVCRMSKGSGSCRIATTTYLYQKGQNMLSFKEFILEWGPSNTVANQVNNKRMAIRQHEKEKTNANLNAQRAETDHQHAVDKVKRHNDKISFKNKVKKFFNVKQPKPDESGFRF